MITSAGALLAAMRMRNPFVSKQIRERNQELVNMGLGGLGRIGGPGWTGWRKAGPDKLRKLNAEHGWGSLVTRTHELGDGTVLGMQFSLPDADDFFELSRLDGAPDCTRLAAAYVAGELTDLAHATELPGVYLAGAICPRGDLSDPADDRDPEGGPGQAAGLERGSASATLFYNAHTPQVQARSIFQIARQMHEATVSLTFASEHDGQAGMWFPRIRDRDRVVPVVRAGEQAARRSCRFGRLTALSCPGVSRRLSIARSAEA